MNDEDPENRTITDSDQDSLSMEDYAVVGDYEGDENGECNDSGAAKIAELQATIDELNDRYLRLAADFENFRKRSSRETNERVNRAIEQFASGILEVADNLERAAGSDDSSLREGLEQIQKILRKVLEQHSIRPIESVNKKFDPEKHEAIAYVPSDSEEGTVIDEVSCGYSMGDRVIRTAKVAVSKGKTEKN
ncbi:GrpE protein [Methanolacinia petrolearia DSM 11571]|uniref:Protein GrpE n=1 Tax=Methanolacinia petrolearia (strain DSM 11571 / OCM 486 / SEBR 4847) TaxID=679926 RepID=E1RID2_METP4|nr:nucleotide exchange factor GrpE [Methanolacinia petrolearia]ADN35445.1 GrpE protein [Methanolacinia petrolearia DSM 11571]